MNQLIKTLSALLDKQGDNAVLHYSLGSEYLKIKSYRAAIDHLYQAIQYRSDYSAAWKQYAQALTANNEPERAIQAYEQGIKVAQSKGDKQAEREMTVFLKRLKKGHPPE